MLDSANDAEVAFSSLFWKWTLYLSFLFASPRYVDDGLLAMVSPCNVIVLNVGALNMAYSVLEVLIRRSYSRAHISTWCHSSCRFRFESASSTRSSAYSRELILGSPCSLSPVP